MNESYTITIEIEHDLNDETIQHLTRTLNDQILKHYNKMKWDIPEFYINAERSYKQIMSTRS